MISSFRGIFPAFLTPLTPERTFNPAMCETMIRFLLAAGVDGTYVAGTTGEGMRLRMEDRMALVETLAAAMPADKKLMVHVGATEKKDAFRLAEHAAKAGAHAISSLPPAGSEAEIGQFYRELASASALPLIVYYFPKVAPHAFADPQQLLDICDHPNVLGVKFTDFNFYLLQRLVARDNMVFNGYDEVLAAGLLMGAQGGIGSTYNVMPEVYRDIYRAAEAGDWEKARTLQKGVTAMIEVLLQFPFFPALRAVMESRGMDCGPMMNGDAFASREQKQMFLSAFEKRFAQVFPQFASGTVSVH